MKHFSSKESFILIETETIDLTDLRNGKISLMYYVVEIYNDENDEVGVLTHEEDGEQVISKFDSFSKAKVQEGLVKQKIEKPLKTRIVSQEENVVND